MSRTLIAIWELFLYCRMRLEMKRRHCAFRLKLSVRTFARMGLHGDVTTRLQVQRFSSEIGVTVEICDGDGAYAKCNRLRRTLCLLGRTQCIHRCSRLIRFDVVTVSN